MRFSREYIFTNVYTFGVHGCYMRMGTLVDFDFVDLADVVVDDITAVVSMCCRCCVFICTTCCVHWVVSCVTGGGCAAVIVVAANRSNNNMRCFRCCDDGCASPKERHFVRRSSAPHAHTNDSIYLHVYRHAHHTTQHRLY